MGKLDRMVAGWRLGFEATPRAIARERAAGFVLLCLFLGLALLLVGACNMQGFPPPPPLGGGGSGGAGGQKQPGSGGTDGPLIGPGGAGGNIGPGGPSGGAPGGVGAGGGDGNTDCLNASFTCVSSCSINTPTRLSGSCDHNGSLTCPGTYVRLTTCTMTACARPPTFSCCDSRTGEITQPPCGPDGLVGECAGVTIPQQLNTCVPPSLGVANCSTLDHQPCELLGQQCRSAGGTPCFCEPGDGGLVWSCPGFGDPPP